MPAVVNDGNVRILKLMKDNLTFWIAVGRTSAWPNESSPPAETVTTETIDQIQGLKRADLVQFVKEDANGTIIFKDKKYSVVEEADIYTDDAIWLYFSGWLLFDQFPVVTFRQTAIFVDVIPTSGNEGKDVLLPSQVQSYGKMIGYVNHLAKTRVSYGKDLVEFVLKMEGQVTTL
jgi:hypothetical protein